MQEVQSSFPTASTGAGVDHSVAPVTGQVSKWAMATDSTDSRYAFNGGQEMIYTHGYTWTNDIHVRVSKKTQEFKFDSISNLAHEESTMENANELIR